jgi:hypothetical protein
MNAYFDVAISNEKDRGISIWCIHVYTVIRQANVHANLNLRPRRTHFKCIGDPYRFRLQSIQDAVYIPADYADNVNITRRTVGDADEGLRRVPMDNTDPVFSSQIWVFDVLDALYDMGVFPDEEFAEAYAVLAFLHQRLVVDASNDG